MNTLIKLEGYKYNCSNVDKVYYACISNSVTVEQYLRTIHKGIMTGYHYELVKSVKCNIEPFGILGYLTRIEKQSDIMNYIQELMCVTDDVV